MAKRTLDSFFSPPKKKPRPSYLQHKPLDPPRDIKPDTNHPTYPWPVPQFAIELMADEETIISDKGKVINDRPDLDLLYFQRFFPRFIEREIFESLRTRLFFYRVKYTIKRFGKETEINTPRYTTVFGLDETSRFRVDDASTGTTTIVDAKTSSPVPASKYKCKPRPIPECLDLIRRITEAATGHKFNFCLVNYYATGSDSISFHSDDEYFLGPEPAIASFTLGAQRDFVMKHKPPKGDATVDKNAAQIPQVKLALASGDMVLMRGPTQANWLHSIPKRKGGDADRGRINITLRRAMIPAGTENYYRYNVGNGGVHRWDSRKEEMVAWVKP